MITNKTLEEKTWENRSDVKHESLMAHIIGWIREKRQLLGLELMGVGHRVVHGGDAYSCPVRVDDCHPYQGRSLGAFVRGLANELDGKFYHKRRKK